MNFVPLLILCIAHSHQQVSTTDADLQPLGPAGVKSEGGYPVIVRIGDESASWTFAGSTGWIVSDSGQGIVRSQDVRAPIYDLHGNMLETAGDLIEYWLLKGPPVRLVVQMEGAGDSFQDSERIFPRVYKSKGKVFTLDQSAPDSLLKFSLDGSTEIGLGVDVPTKWMGHPMGTGYLLAGCADVWTRRTRWSTFLPFNSNKYAYAPIAISSSVEGHKKWSTCALFRKVNLRTYQVALETFEIAVKYSNGNYRATMKSVNEVSLPTDNLTNRTYFPEPYYPRTVYPDAPNQKFLLAPRKAGHPLLVLDKHGSAKRYQQPTELFAHTNQERGASIDYLVLLHGRPVISVVSMPMIGSNDQLEARILVFDSQTHFTAINGYALRGHSTNGKYLMVSRVRDNALYIVKVK